VSSFRGEHYRVHVYRESVEKAFTIGWDAICKEFNVPASKHLASGKQIADSYCRSFKDDATQDPEFEKDLAAMSESLQVKD
jgi:hypothetical protein